MASDMIPIPPALLMAHAGFLRGLARALVGDETRGADLAQEALLRALERPPRRPLALSSWFRQVIRNLAVNAARGERRRLTREERAARPEATHSALDEAMMRERIRLLTEAVLGLPEPFQGALLLRFFNDLDYAEIGRRQEVPEATARSRVHRALARLREELNRFHGGDRGAWLDGLLPLALPGLLEGRPLFGPAAAAARPAAWYLGGVAMKMLLLVVGLTTGLAMILTSGFGSPRIPETLAGGGSMPAATLPGLEEVEIQEDPVARNPVIEERDAWVLGSTFPSPEPSGIPAEDAVEVRVVEAGTGRPVPGATFAWWGNPNDWPDFILLDDLCHLERSPWPLGPDRLVETFAPKGFAGDDGTVLFPRRPWPVKVWAWHGERWGEGAILPDQVSPFRLELQEPRRVTLQVVDGEGRPCPGVVVSLLAREGSGCFFVWKGRTAAPDGVVEAVYHPGRIRNQRRMSQLSFKEGRHRLTLWATFAAPIVDGPEVQIDLDAPPTSPIRLEHPPTGRLVVRLEDPLRNPAAVAGLALLRVRSDSGQSGRYVPEYVKEPIKDGVVLFPAVSLDRSLELHFQPAEREWYMPQVTGKGPTRPGEEVVLPVRLKARGSARGGGMLRGRLTDGQGRALAGILVHLNLATGQSWTPRVARTERVACFRTDPEGRFSTFGDGNVAPGERRELTFTWWQRTTPAGVPKGPGCRLEIEGPEPLEGRDLGDFALTNSPLLAEGVVRDASGSPVPGVTVKRMWADDKVIPAKNRGQWMTTTDAEGRFRLEGYGSGMISLIASTVTARCQLTVSAGTRGIDLVLAPGPGCVDVSLLCDPGIPPRSVTVFIDDRGPIYPFPDHCADGGTAHGRLSSRDSGPRTIRFQLGAWVMSQVSEVLVRPGEITRDPRLLPVDLRGRVKLLRLEILDERRTPVGGGVWVASSRSPGPFKKVYPNSQEFALGSLHAIAVPVEHDRFLVGVVGQPPREVAWQECEQQVVLARGCCLRLRPSLPPCPMKAGDRKILHFGGQFVPVELPPWITPEILALCPRPGRTELQAGTEQGFRVALPGTYAFQFWAAVQVGEGPAVEWIEIPVAKPPSFEISATNSVPVAEIALDPSDVEHAFRTRSPRERQ